MEEFRFHWEDKVFKIGASVGLVPLNAQSGSGADVLSAADTACYAAKDQGGNRTHVYHENDAELLRRQAEMQWVGRINQALEENRFQLVYQPIIPIRGQSDEGKHHELLIRLRDEQGRLTEPSTFLPAAERYGLLTKLDRWVLSNAFRWYAEHPEELAELHLCCINISGQSMGDGGFLQFVVRQIEEFGVPGEKLCFELTETTAIADITSAVQFIKELKKLGVLFALDDFGSGLSSFGYLKTLPVDFLKIDGVFVKDIATDAVDLAMVRSINDIGHVMGKRTIAEFVENDAILQLLKEIGVDFVQGYGIARPRPMEELARLRTAS